MKLIFSGHDYRYAVEQSLLAFFPNERPVYEGEDTNTASVRLTVEGLTAHAATELSVDGKTASGTSQIDISDAADGYERERLLQRAVKLSFFEAARSLTGVTPAWGALTGIRPAKLAAGLLEEGNTEAETDAVLRDTYFVSDSRRALCLPCAKAGLEAKRDLEKNEISLYIGIPFCAVPIAASSATAWRRVFT